MLPWQMGFGDGGRDGKGGWMSGREREKREREQRGEEEGRSNCKFQIGKVGIIKCS